ncbi:MAG: bifunctional riboflavin kinase/FAD synthetase [Chloroflexota bacterium]|nr:bifunctional riboflavin kinase/FAD synthetase [Chloroflexota bacterium]
MQTITDLTQRQPTPAVLTIGSFDGVHLGHQALIASVVESARARNVAAVALTFEPSPREVLRPELSLAYLTRLPQKLELLGSLGLDETIVVPFTQELSRVQAPDFIAMLRQYLPFVEMWEGEGFALGHGRTGNTDVLARLGEELGYTLRIAPLVKVEGEPVSSTRVRQAVAEGDVEAAARLLGRHYGVPGVVVHGSKRGRELGYPTANLDTPPNQAIPADGVYATWCVRPATGETLPSLTSIGVRPMFENDVRLVEVYILDYDADLYDETLTAQFVHYLRPQQRFDGLEAFIAQMRKDEANARKLLGVR